MPEHIGSYPNPGRKLPASPRIVPDIAVCICPLKNWQSRIGQKISFSGLCGQTAGALDPCAWKGCIASVTSHPLYRFLLQYLVGQENLLPLLIFTGTWRLNTVYRFLVVFAASILDSSMPYFDGWFSCIHYWYGVCKLVGIAVSRVMIRKTYLRSIMSVSLWILSSWQIWIAIPVFLENTSTL